MTSRRSSVNPSQVKIVHNQAATEFKMFYMKTFEKFFNMRTDKIPYDNDWVWNSKSVFRDLSPWESSTDFGLMCNRLISCALAYTKRADPALCSNLTMALNLIESKLPKPAPKEEVPWGLENEWRYFSITMPEALLAMSVVLTDNAHADETVVKLLVLYLPKANDSLNWERQNYDAIKMGVPYIYSQLLQNILSRTIAEEAEVKHILNLLKFQPVESGNGMHSDLIPFSNKCVRSYAPLVSTLYCLGYYTYLFGEAAVNNEKIYSSLQYATTSPHGLTNPALNTRLPSLIFKNVFELEVEFHDGIFWAEKSKILTMRTPRSFACVVGICEQFAYYEACPRNDRHAPLWAMNKRLHNRHHPVDDYTDTNFIYESGIILFHEIENIVVPTVTTFTSTFVPKATKTAIVTLPNLSVGAIYSEGAFTELLHLKFTSVTILFENNLIQLYYNIHIDPKVMSQPYVVALNLPADCALDENQGNYNSVTANGITAMHMNIDGKNSFPDFRLTVHNSTDRTINQVVDLESCKVGRGTCCFRHTVADTPVSRVVARYNAEYGSYVFRFLNGRVRATCGPNYLGLYDSETKYICMSTLSNGNVFIRSADIHPALMDLQLGTCGNDRCK